MNNFFSTPNIDLIFNYTRQAFLVESKIDINSIGKKKDFLLAIYQVMKSVVNSTNINSFKSQKDLIFYLNKMSIEKSVIYLSQLYKKSEEFYPQESFQVPPELKPKKDNDPLLKKNQQQQILDNSQLVNFRDDNLISKINRSEDLSSALFKMEQLRKLDDPPPHQPINFAQQEQSKLFEQGISLPKESDIIHSFEPNKSDLPKDLDLNSDIFLPCPSLKFTIKSTEFKLPETNDHFNSIELISAIIPKSGFNIPCLKVFNFKESNSIKSIEIPPGNYSQDSLILKISQELQKSGLSSYSFDICPLQNTFTIKSSPESKHNAKKFELHFDQNNSIAPFIGFESKIYSGKFEYTGSSPINLNYQNYLELFIPELYDKVLFTFPLEKPVNFIKRNFENEYVSEILFNQSISNLTLTFKDPFGANYNFNNSHFLLNFQLKTI